MPVELTADDVETLADDGELLLRDDGEIVEQVVLDFDDPEELADAFEYAAESIRVAFGARDR